MNTSSGSSAELRLICAGGFKAAIEKLAPRFEHASGQRLAITIGTPADTRRMMTDGTPFDAAVVTRVSLNEAAAAALDPATRFGVAKSPVGMGVRKTLPAPEIVSMESFRSAIAAVGTIGLSDPKAGTNLANDILAAAAGLGLRAAIEAKARYFLGPGFVVAKRVAAGEADAVMTLATEIKPAEGIRYLGAVPDSMGLGTPFDAGIARAHAGNPSAQAFIAYLKTEEARSIMQSTGLVML